MSSHAGCHEMASEMPVRQSGPISNIPSGGHKIGC
jgi:hypothetical protein